MPNLLYVPNHFPEICLILRAAASDSGSAHAEVVLQLRHGLHREIGVRAKVVAAWVKVEAGCSPCRLAAVDVVDVVSDHERVPAWDVPLLQHVNDGRGVGLNVRKFACDNVIKRQAEFEAQ